MTSATYQTLLGAPRIKQSTDWLQKHVLIVSLLLFLVLGIVGIQIGSHYFSRDINLLKSSALAGHTASISGLNSSVNDAQLQAQLNAISSQPATLNLGYKTVPISPNIIRSWLKITPGKSADGIHVNAKTISASLTQLASQYEASPRNEVISTAEGSPQVIIAGHAGAQLSSSADISDQSQQLAKNLLGGKGFQINAPLESVPFASVTPAAFGKLIEVDVATKQMYLFQNGQIVNSYAVSAGKPSTPTPLGEFHIFEKFAVQDMKGTNPDGTPYVQPHVHWINYFLPGGYAIHGVYWHPLSWFGANNSSHGCVGVPDDIGESIYNWAPLGTTVITHA